MTAEAAVEKYLVGELAKRGVETRKVKWIGRRNAPDRLVFACGGIWLELKAPGEAPTRAQLGEHLLMRAAGMRVKVIDSIEGVDNFINEIRS